MELSIRPPATTVKSPVILVIPSLLQMGWVESSPFFCAATKTSRDIAMQYSNTAVGLLNKHKFEAYLKGDVTFKDFKNRNQMEFYDTCSRSMLTTSCH